MIKKGWPTPLRVCTGRISLAGPHRLWNRIRHLLK